MSKIEKQVCQKIMMRSHKGKNKYGVTMERDDLNIHQWLDHAQEEAMDLAVYLERIKMELEDLIQDEVLKRLTDDDCDCCCPEECDCDYEVVPPGTAAGAWCGTPALWDEDKMERRINIIGQNGNDGEHYDDRINNTFMTTSVPHTNISRTDEVQKEKRSKNNKK